MQIELIALGVLILACILPLKFVVHKTAYRQLPIAFVFLWGMLFAFHYWGAATGLVSGFLAMLDPKAVEAVAFLLALLAGCIPGILLLRGLLGPYETTFPPVMDHILAGIGSIIVGVGIPAVIVMTALASSQTLDDRINQAGGAVTTGVHAVRNIPTGTYLRLAVAFNPGRSRDDLIRERFPLGARKMLLPEQAGPTRRPNR